MSEGSQKSQDIFNKIEDLTVKELVDLIKALEEKHGAPVQAAAAAPAAQEAASEQSEFTVVLNDAGANKINVIKVVREITKLGLKEAKELVENKGTIAENVKKEDAESIKEKLAGAGASVDLK